MNLYFSTNGPRNFKVYYQPGMDGGGTWFGQEYIEVIKQRYPDKQFDNCLEWCAGPAFIGYAILDHALCRHLTLVEIHEPTAAMADKSRLDAHNQCADEVTIYNIGDISQLPEHEKFDLIVGNPPHFLFPSVDPDVSRIESDPNWAVHQNFYANIAEHLAPGGVILLQENMLESRPDSFKYFIREAGLKITDWFESPNWFKKPDDMCQIYYLEVRHN